MLHKIPFISCLTLDEMIDFNTHTGRLVAGNVELADFELGKSDDQEYYILMKIASDDCGS